MLKATPGERLGCPWPAHKGARSHQYPALDRLTHARDRARLLKPLLLAPLPKLGLLHLGIGFVLRTKHIAPAGAQNHALERLTHARDRSSSLAEATPPCETSGAGSPRSRNRLGPVYKTLSAGKCSKLNSLVRMVLLRRL